MPQGKTLCTLCVTKWEFKNLPVAPGNENWDRKLYLTIQAHTLVSDLLLAMEVSAYSDLLDYFTDDVNLAGRFDVLELGTFCQFLWGSEPFKNAEFILTPVQ